MLPSTNGFPITDEYFNFILSEMQRHNYIQLQINRAWGGDIVNIDISGIQKTQEGIDHLSENSKIRKAIKTIPAAAAVLEIFM